MPNDTTDPTRYPPGIYWSRVEALQAFFDLLSEFQKTAGCFRKTDTNSYYGNEYAGLPSVIETVQPYLKKAGWTVCQPPGTVEDGAMTISTIFIHKSGDWVSFRSGSPLAKPDPQAMGSAITYMRRYALIALFGVPVQDDDAEGAMPERAKPPAKPKKKSKVESTPIPDTTSIQKPPVRPPAGRTIFGS